MEYSQLKNHIKQFLEGNLSKTGELELLEWINQSPENRSAFYHLQQILAGEMKFNRNELVAKRWKLLLKRINPEKTNRNSFPFSVRKYVRFASPVAAAFFVGFIIAGFLLWDFDQKEEKNIFEQKISAPHGARTQFMLPDSSVVWLNAGSEIVFASSFENERGVRLEGEAYFEIKKRENPFVVTTAYGAVEVEGTSFNIAAYHDAPFQTTLVEGKVNVLTGNRKEVALRPGQQAVYEGEGCKVDVVDPELFISWTQGKLIFREDYLPQLATKLERWYNVDIEIGADPRLQKINYTGTIEMETFSEVLNLLSVTAPVDYTWNEKTRVIKLFYKSK